MADEDKNGSVPVWAQIVGGIGAGLSGGRNAAIDWEQFHQEQVTKRKHLQQQQQEIDLRQKEMSARLYQTANTQMSSIMEGALMSSDPEAYMSNNSESWRSRAITMCWGN